MAFNRGTFDDDQSEAQALLQRISEAVGASRQSGGVGRDFNPGLESSEERQRLSQSSIQKLGELGRLRDEFDKTGTSNPGDIQIREALAKDIGQVMKELKFNEKARTRQENIGRKLEGKLGTIKAADDHSVIPDLDSIERDITNPSKSSVAKQQQTRLAGSGLELQGATFGPGGLSQRFGQPTKEKAKVDRNIFNALAGRELPLDIVESLEKLPNQQGLSIAARLRDNATIRGIDDIEAATQKFLGRELTDNEYKKLLGITLKGEKPELDKLFKQITDFQKFIDLQSQPQPGEGAEDVAKRMQPLYTHMQTLLKGVYGEINLNDLPPLPDPSVAETNKIYTDNLTGRTYITDGFDWFDAKTGDNLTNN